jgi:hypothetical protein
MSELSAMEPTPTEQRLKKWRRVMSRRACSGVMQTDDVKTRLECGLFL